MALHCVLEIVKKRMKRSSALSTLQNGVFRKGALRFSFYYLHIITRTYYFEATYLQIFFHIVLITFLISGLMIFSFGQRGGGMEILNRMELARIKKIGKRNYFRFSQCGLRS